MIDLVYSCITKAYKARFNSLKRGKGQGNNYMTINPGLSGECLVYRNTLQMSFYLILNVSIFVAVKSKQNISIQI